MGDDVDRAKREKIWSHEHPVVPFPYEWITVNEGVRRLVKNIGLDEKEQRGEQGQPLLTGKKI